MFLMGAFVNRWTTCVLMLLHQSSASTHWIVTEDGRIQAQMDSVFSLKRPYDLVALMQQEKRAVLIEELKEQLMTQKEEIDHREDKETNLEGRIYASDEDCMAAEKPLTEFDLYASTVVPFDYKGFDGDDFLSTTLPEENLNRPNCTEVVNLDFSMHAFEHLMGVRDRVNLTMSPEDGLHRAVTTIENIEAYGQLVYDAIKKNSTSWILFNMAAYFWRVKGDAYNAVECVRRALHFSPREHKDIALISLGNILHHSRLSEEAAIVVHAAVDIAPENAICHFTLGNIYAVLADYNKSIICFENTLKVQPDFKNAEQRYHAVMCHSKLEKALEAQHHSLQKTLTELREYQKQHEFWLKQHETLLNEQAPPEVKLEQRLEYEEQKIRESLDGRGPPWHSGTVSASDVEGCGFKAGHCISALALVAVFRELSVSVNHMGERAALEIASRRGSGCSFSEWSAPSPLEARTVSSLNRTGTWSSAATCGASRTTPAPRPKWTSASTCNSSRPWKVGRDASGRKWRRDHRSNATDPERLRTKPN